MKKAILLALCSVVLFSCAPVLNRSYLTEGAREVSFSALRQNPDAYKGRVFVFGGVLIETRMTAEGSQVEAIHVPVDRYGYFHDRGQSEGRFYAVLPQNEGMLDPEVYTKGRRVSIAAEFLELRKGRIDEMEYLYPVFRVRQVHLWPRERTYYPAYYYDPWFHPYPYYYWDPWWRYPYYYNYYNYNYRPGPPVYRRSRPPNQPPPAQSPQLEQRRSLPERVPGPGRTEPAPERRR
ncbi:MAG: hypothetical protein A2078_13105 [Nitrospirae bacterium GWC2_57_9]|nr:MAG: hypothetical protein A2078_13105 [Nitrospirae bacterium GWC2_57_9]